MALKVYVNLCRFVLAAVFIFSGFVKADDPLGFEYKLADYVAALGLDAWLAEELLLPLAVAVAALEFILGIYLLFGINSRFTSWVTLLMMAVMTPLTLWMALENPVSDCGCFGDAVTLSNWETFWKNVLLFAMSVSVTVWRRSVFRVITRRAEWLLSTYTLFYILAFAYYCILHLPVFDFRPYRVGTVIREAMSVPEGKEPPLYETLFLMEKEGEQREFSVDDYPDTTWTFISRRMMVVREGYVPPVQDFTVTRITDEEDISEELLDEEGGYTFLLVAPYMEKADDGYIDLVNELYDYCLRYGYAFYCLTASDEPQIENWRDCTGAEYPFCRMEETQLKTIVRANPGVVLLKDGQVIGKWSARDIPDESVLTDCLENLSIGQLSVQSYTYKLTVVVLCFVCPLALLLLADGIYRYRSRRLKRKLNN